MGPGQLTARGKRMHYHLGQVEVVMMVMMVINYIVESVSTMQNEAHRS